MPQFDPTTFLPQLFWLAVTFAVLFFVISRHALPRLSSIMEARQQRINTDLDKAANIKKEAEQVLAAYERALGEARDQAAAAVKRAGNETTAESARRHERLGTELAGKAREAEQRIAAARDQALADIKTVAADAASAATTKLIGVEVTAEQVRRAVDAAAGSQS